MPTLLAAAVLTLNNREVARHVNMFVSETLPALKHIDNIKANTKSMVLIGYSLYGYTLEASEFDEQFDRIKESMESDGIIKCWQSVLACTNSIGEQGIHLTDVERITFREIFRNIDETFRYG